MDDESRAKLLKYLRQRVREDLEALEAYDTTWERCYSAPNPGLEFYNIAEAAESAHKRLCCILELAPRFGIGNYELSPIPPTKPL